MRQVQKINDKDGKDSFLWKNKKNNNDNNNN